MRVADGKSGLSARGRPRRQSGFGLGLDDLTTTVKAIRADVVAQVGFASGRLHGNARLDQGVVRTVHAALGRRLFVLLNSHGAALKCVRQRNRGLRAPPCNE